MKKHMVFFVIMAVVMMATIGCDAAERRHHGGEERHQSHKRITWQNVGFGAYLTLGSETLLGASDANYAQDYSLTDRGVDVKLSPITPNFGNWQVTQVKWSNGKQGYSTWVTNANYDKFTNMKVSMAVTITWEDRGLTTTADGKFQQTVRDSYTETFFFNVQHCARIVRHR